MTLPTSAHNGVRLLLPALILTVSLSGLTQNAYPQVSASRASVHGTVTFLESPGNLASLSGVTVRLTPASPGTTALSAATDENGVYQFASLPSATYTFEVSLAGFQTQTETVDLSPGAILVRDFTLRLAATSQTAVVRESASPIATENVSTVATVTSQQIVALPLPQPTVAAALPLVPSVVQSRSGTLSFKGASENEGMQLVDSAENVEPVTGNFSIPISIDAIQSLAVKETPYRAEYGGFSGGLTEIQTKPPADHWQFLLSDFIPGMRGKNDHIVGISAEDPRLYLTGPLWKNKLHFSEAVTYSFMRPPVRGLAWPFNETVTTVVGGRTSVEALLSPRHVVNVNLNLFYQRVKFADINALVPQSASSNDGQRGFSVGASDSYEFASGMLMRTVVQFTRLDSNAGGQGLADMLITPESWSGNYFNSWSRNSSELQILPSLQLRERNWHGHHELKEGVDVNRRAYDGNTQSHPVQLLREDGSLAEQINFQGAGITRGVDTEVGEYIEDHWTMNNRLSADLGARLESQVAGSPAAFAPRLGLAYSLDKSQKTAIHAGAGLFYDRVPMLATDFTDNLTRVVSLFDTNGELTGPPITFENVNLQKISGGGFAIATDDLDAAPRNFTWNLELDRELRSNLQLRVSYLESATADLPVVLPMPGSPDGPSLMGLAYSGNSRYHAIEAAVHFQPTEQDTLDVAYIHSRSRSDLNLLSNIFIPFEQPVIRPNSYGTSPWDVPNRLVVTGSIALPWQGTISPVLDVHSGLPYSSVDVLQNYAGMPNAQRFPFYFSLDFQIYREFQLSSWKLLGPLRKYSLRAGFYSLDATNHVNPNAVYNNITSSNFGNFAGYVRRVDGFVLEMH